MTYSLLFLLGMLLLRDPAWSQPQPQPQPQPHLQLQPSHADHTRLTEIARHFHLDPSNTRGLQPLGNRSDYIVQVAAKTDSIVRLTDATSPEQQSRRARVYAGLQSGVILLWPFVGISAGMSPFPDLPRLAIEADYGIALHKGAGYPWFTVGFGWRKMKQHGTYLRIGRTKAPGHPHYLTFSVGLRRVAYQEGSILIGVEGGFDLLIPHEDVDNLITLPYWDLRLRMERILY